MGRKRQKHHKTATHFSASEERKEREKIKESILNVFRSRLKLPDESGALLVGESKESKKDQDNQNETTQDGYSSYESRGSMTGQETAKKKKQSTVKRRKPSARSKHKSEKKSSEESSAVAKHLKIARSVSHSLAPNREVDRGIANMITHARITQPLGLTNNGRKSAPVRRAALSMSGHIRKNTEEQLKKTLMKDDDGTHGLLLTLDKAQSSVVNSESSPTYSDEFPEILPLRETVISMVSSLKEASKQLYPGRNCLKEVRSELLKVMKQNAPRSATPALMPLCNKLANYGSVQRKLIDQFPGKNESPYHPVRVVTESHRGKDNIHQVNDRPDYSSQVPHSFSCTDSNLLQPVMKNIVSEKDQSVNWKPSSIQNYKNSRTQPNHNLQLLANDLENLHKGKENRDFRQNVPEKYNTVRNQDNIGSEYETEHHSNICGLKSSSGNLNYYDIGSDTDKTGKPIYVLSKHKTADNLQLLKDNAKMLQLQHKNVTEEIRKKLLKNKLVISSNSPEKNKEVGGFLRNVKANHCKNDLASAVFMDHERINDYEVYHENNMNVPFESKSVYKGENGRPVTKDGIFKVLDAKALNHGDEGFELMQVDDRIWELDTGSTVLKNELFADRMKQAGCIGNAGDNVRSFLENVVTETHSRSSSQCSHCSCATSRYSGSQHEGDILSQVDTTKTDYMPSFHGSYYDDPMNSKDLLLEQRKADMQLDASAMDFLDYIEAETRSRPRLCPIQLSQMHDRSAAEDHSRRLKSIIKVEINSPDEPKLYPRKMY